MKKDLSRGGGNDVYPKIPYLRVHVDHDTTLHQDMAEVEFKSLPEGVIDEDTE